MITPQTKIDGLRDAALLGEPEWISCDECDGTGMHDELDGSEFECAACDGEGGFWVNADLPNAKAHTRAGAQTVDETTDSLPKNEH